MATKFKPKEPIQTTIPNSVSSEEIPEDDAMMVLIDSTNRVFFSVLSEKDSLIHYKVLNKIASARQMTFTGDQQYNFRRIGAVGVPFSQLNSFLSLDEEEQGKVTQPGIPVTDTVDNQLVSWIGAIKQVYAEETKELKYLVKGDGKATYPTVEAVIAAFKKNDQLLQLSKRMTS
jgi:hypothetical protein